MYVCVVLLRVYHACMYGVVVFNVSCAVRTHVFIGVYSCGGVLHVCVLYVCM